MSKLEGVIATTNIDSHGECMTLAALESMIATISRHYVPFGWEHDPRIAPLGRIVNAWLEHRTDGSSAVRAEIELFDDTFEVGELDGEREIVTKSYDSATSMITFDRNFTGAEDQVLLEQLASGTGATLRMDVKKSLDPMSILTVGTAIAAATAIANGFLGKLGEDGYDLLKKTVKKLFAKPKEGEKERLFILEFEVHREGERLIVEVIATNPTPEQIDRLLDIDLHKLDALVDATFRPGLKKLVFEADQDGIIVKFAVRRDGVPLRQNSPGDDLDVEI